MKFCQYCNSAMKMEVINSTVIFNCCCKNSVKGEDDDLCIYEENYAVSSNIQDYNKLLKNIAQDPTINTIYNKCKKCGSEYMGQIRITENETIFRVCTCGHVE
jgi:DNA-directed RNA polymerase subunit M/transcription elongation factor TFIIS